MMIDHFAFDLKNGAGQLIRQYCCKESNAFIAALLTALNTIPDGETVGDTMTASESMLGATHGTATSGKQIRTDLL